MANTPNLGLHQWQSDDSFLREEFNEDFRKIDTAVGAGLKCAAGSFVGNGVYPRKITLPRRPRLIMLEGVYNYVSSRYTATLISSETIQLFFANGQQHTDVVEYLDDGFRITEEGYFNDTGDTTKYFCLY